MVFLIEELSHLVGASGRYEIDIALTTLETGTGADFSYLERL
jgi:hypothetical protein